MRAAALTLARAILLAGPTALAFASGGYFDEARLLAAIAAWALVAIAAVAAERPLPASPTGRAALGGLALLAGWTALSIAWAPLAGPAFHDAQRVVLYLGALTAALLLLRPRGVARAVEPALVAGALIAVGYGCSERLLPGLVHLTRTASALGRLDQPLTYWNAMGALAAIGLVIAIRLIGDRTRPDGLRVASASAAAPLGMGLYLTFSRGALGALVAGTVVLLALAPTWPQLRAATLALTSGAAAALTASRLEGVQSLVGTISSREREGAIALALLVVLMGAAAVYQAWACRAERRGRGRSGRLPLPRRSPAIAAVIVVLIAGALVAAASRESRTRSPISGAHAARLGSLQSHRYEYWKVAMRTFANHPALGVGSGGFAVEWLRHRPFRESAQDAHSLYLETAAELGLVGVLALVVLLAAIALAAREAHRRDPALAAGACAGLAAWALHAGIDWDWEMPALTLVAVALAGMLIAAADEPSGDGERLP